MKKLLLVTTLSTSLLLSDDILKNISLDSIGLNIGSSSSPFSKKDIQGSISLANEPDESFKSFEIFALLDPISRICKDKNMKPYLSYTYSINEDIKHQYLLSGINKYYKYKNSFLYIGGSLGYGQIDWRYDPLNISKSKNIDANSFIFGIQGGIEFPLNKKLSLGLNSKFLLHRYETKLNPSNGILSTLEHKSTKEIMLGIKYSF